MHKHLATKLVAALALLVGTTTSALAQSNQTQNTIGALGNLFGALAQAGAKANALKQWQAQDAQIIQCINTIYASKNITADSFVAAGVGPNDQRVAPVITLCKAVMAAQPKVDFPCNVTNANGQQVASKCSEAYAVSRNGSLVAVSRDDFLRAAGNGEQVQVANFETAEANAARLQAEQLQAERKRFMASPEGKRQLAVEAAQARQAQAIKRQQDVARAAAHANEPRGYELVCTGSTPEDSNLNLIKVDCRNYSDVLSKMRWAYFQSINSGNDYAKTYAQLCSNSISYLRKDLSYEEFKSSVSSCNRSAYYIKGPSANQVSGGRK